MLINRNARSTRIAKFVRYGAYAVAAYVGLKLLLGVLAIALSIVWLVFLAAVVALILYALIR